MKVLFAAAAAAMSLVLLVPTLTVGPVDGASEHSITAAVAAHADHARA